MRTRLKQLLVGGLAAVTGASLLVPALGGNGDPDSTTGYQTVWETPFGVTGPDNPPSSVSGEAVRVCEWSYWIRPALVDDRKHDPPRGFWCEQDAYAHCIADGMQIFAYGWAYDDCMGGDASAGISASSTGMAQVFARTVPEGCPYRVVVDWIPRFRVRVQQLDTAGVVQAGGVMEGSIPEMALTVRIAEALEARSEAEGEGGVTATVAVPGIKGSLQVPLTRYVGSAPQERSPIAFVHQEAKIKVATATYLGHSWVSVYANANMMDWYAESEGFVWQSEPRLDLHGECTTPCVGFAYVDYGW